MIYILLLIDILINNYTKFTSFFFLIFLYNKPYKYFLLTGLILDLIIFNTFYNTIILSLMYFLNKIFTNLNKQNFYNYLFFTIFNYLIFIFMTNLISFNSLSNILVFIGNNLFINTIFYLLSFRIVKNNCLN